MTTDEWERIVAELHVEDPDRAFAAYEALDRAADESWLPRLHQLLAEGKDFFVREAAANPIARMEGVKALPQLLIALRRGEDDGYDNDSLCALVSDLIHAEAKHSASVILPMLKSPADRDRADAAWALGFAAAAITPEPLLIALGDSSVLVRGNAASSLSEFKLPEVVDALLGALTDEAEEVRGSAAASLGDIGDPRALPALRKAKSDSSKEVRFWVKEALGKIEDPSSGFLGRFLRLFSTARKNF